MAKRNRIGMVQIKPQPTRTLREYYDECLHMLNQQPGDWHVGAMQREVIAMCHVIKRPVQNCVSLLMKMNSNNS